MLGSGGRPRRMVSLGKVTAPKPVNLPSQRLENNGLDPNIDLVGRGVPGAPGTSGGVGGWGSGVSTPSQAASGRVTPEASSAAAGIGPGNPAAEDGDAAHRLPARAIPAVPTAAWGGLGLPEERQRAMEAASRAQFPGLGMVPMAQERWAGPQTSGDWRLDASMNCRGSFERDSPRGYGYERREREPFYGGDYERSRFDREHQDRRYDGSGNGGGPVEGQPPSGGRRGGYEGDRFYERDRYYDREADRRLYERRGEGYERGGGREYYARDREPTQHDLGGSPPPYFPVVPPPPPPPRRPASGETSSPLPPHAPAEALAEALPVPAREPIFAREPDLSASPASPRGLLRILKRCDAASPRGDLAAELGALELSAAAEGAATAEAGPAEPEAPPQLEPPSAAPEPAPRERPQPRRVPVPVAPRPAQARPSSGRRGAAAARPEDENGAAAGAPPSAHAPALPAPRVAVLPAARSRGRGGARGGGGQAGSGQGAPPSARSEARGSGPLAEEGQQRRGPKRAKGKGAGASKPVRPEQEGGPASGGPISGGLASKGPISGGLASKGPISGGLASKGPALGGSGDRPAAGRPPKARKLRKPSGAAPGSERPVAPVLPGGEEGGAPAKRRSRRGGAKKSRPEGEPGAEAGAGAAGGPRSQKRGSGKGRGGGGGEGGAGRSATPLPLEQ